MDNLVDTKFWLMCLWWCIVSAGAQNWYDDIIEPAEFNCAVGWSCPDGAAGDVLLKLSGISLLQCQRYCTETNCVAFNYTNSVGDCSLFGKPCGFQQLEHAGLASQSRYCAIRCPPPPACDGCIVNQNSELNRDHGLTVSEASYSCMDSRKSVVGPAMLKCNSTTTFWMPAPKCIDKQRSDSVHDRNQEPRPSEPQTSPALEPTFDCMANWFCPINPRHNQLIERQPSPDIDNCTSACANRPDCVAFNYYAGVEKPCVLLRIGCKQHMLRAPTTVMVRVNRHQQTIHCAKTCPPLACENCLVSLSSELDHNLTVRITEATISCPENQRLFGPKNLRCDTRSLSWGRVLPSCRDA